MDSSQSTAVAVRDLAVPSSSAGVCPACDSAESRLLFHAHEPSYSTSGRVCEIVECARCRLIRLHPEPTPTEQSRSYPPGYWTDVETSWVERWEGFFRRFVLRDRVRFVERALKESGAGGLVLDVGCGNGDFLQLLAEGRHRQVAGLDFALDAARAAWTGAGVPAICATLSRAPLASGSCSVITMFHVLEHLYRPHGYLEAARDLLAANGRLIVQLPNAACWQFLLFGERWSGLEAPHGLFQFRRRDVEVLLEETGFEILRCKYFSWRDNPQGMATSIAPGLDPSGRRLRGVKETPRLRFWKDVAYLGLVVLCLPFTWLEAGCRAGSTVTIEARKKPLH